MTNQITLYNWAGDKKIAAGFASLGYTHNVPINTGESMPADVAHKVARQFTDLGFTAAVQPANGKFCVFIDIGMFRQR